jgi:ABC-type transport system involved in multi-copper enzyme maturation permease subunit
MSEGNQNCRAIIELEVETSYRFPIVETVVAIIVFVGLVGAASYSNRAMTIALVPGQSWNGTEASHIYSSFLEQTSTSAYMFSLTSYAGILVFLIPFLVAFTTARGFEDGTLQTILSYPVSRSKLLLSRFVLTATIVGVPATLAPLTVVYGFIPGPKNIEAILMLAAALWAVVILMTSMTMLVSVVLRGTLVTALTGVVLWSAVAVLTFMPGFPALISGILNPMHIVQRYMIGIPEGPFLTDVAIALAGCVIFGIVALVASLGLFSRAEV